jgi:ribonuclease VapC
VSSWVLDSSALLAIIHGEPGAQRVAAALAAGAAISTVNLAEVITKLTERGFTPDDIEASVAKFQFERIDFDSPLAVDTGLLRAVTRSAGLSLGDRACLALARRLGLPVLTADRAWQTVQLGVQVEVIR